MMISYSFKISFKMNTIFMQNSFLLGAYKPKHFKSAYEFKYHFLVTFSFYQVCLILGQLVLEPLVSKQSENYTLTGEVPLQDQKTSPKTLPSLTAAPREPGNLQNAGSTEAASNHGEPRAPIQGTKPGPQAAVGVAARLFPRA